MDRRRPLAPVSRSLDPELILVLVDVADRLVVGRPGSLAESTVADFKISFARLSSAEAPKVSCRSHAGCGSLKRQG